MCVQSAAMCMIRQSAILTQALLRELHSRIYLMIGYALSAVSAKIHSRHSKKRLLSAGVFYCALIIGIVFFNIVHALFISLNFFPASPAISG